MIQIKTLIHVYIHYVVDFSEMSVKPANFFKIACCAINNCYVCIYVNKMVF